MEGRRKHRSNKKWEGMKEKWRDEGEVGRRGHENRFGRKERRKNMLNHWWFVF